MSITAPSPHGQAGSPTGSGLLPVRLAAIFNMAWERYGRFLHQTHRIPLRTLSLYRIAFAMYLLVMNPIPDLRWIASYPGEFHNPAPGLMYIWGSFPPAPVLVALEVATVLAACALAIGWRTMWTSIAVTIAGLLANSVYMSFGKIDHTTVLWLLPALMATSGWGAYWSSDHLAAMRGAPRSGSGYAAGPADARSPGWPVASAALMLGLAFLSASLPKVAKGWLSFDSSGALSYFRYLYFALGRNELLANTFINVDVAPLWELLDWATVALELSVGLIVWWTVGHRWALFAAWLFHLSVMAVMNISFIGPTPIYALFFLTLINPARSQRVGEWLLARKRLAVPLLVPVAAIALFGRGLYVTTVVDWLGVPMTWAEFLYFVFGLVVLTAALFKSRGFTRTF